ncbi:MAG: Na+/H+ antiporter subunit E [Gemmatimonadetes bacterium]|nr:Na+/H+ antiporter subunit E [Gemmatimonadota bacterium]
MFVTWLLWSGHLEPLLVGLGALSCVVIVALSVRMGAMDDEGPRADAAWRLASYVPWLLWQIVLANIDVARRILSPKLPIAPRLIRVRAKQKSALGRTIFANSITLTPGTVSVDLDGEDIVVHALTSEAASELQEGAMNRRVAGLEAP